MYGLLRHSRAGAAGRPWAADLRATRRP